MGQEFPYRVVAVMNRGNPVTHDVWLELAPFKNSGR
jgi:hypothetical protein